MPSTDSAVIAVSEALAAQTQAHFLLDEANDYLGELPRNGTSYWTGRDRLEDAVLHLVKGKWYLGRAIGTHRGVAQTTRDPEDVRAGTAHLNAAREVAEAALCDRSAVTEVRLPQLTTASECRFADDVPLVPTICPTVVLSGSWQEMGRQYVEQLTALYGTWIVAHQVRAPADELLLQRWVAPLREYAPEMFDFALGWAEGARSAGLPMTDEMALTVMTAPRQVGAQPSFFSPFDVQGNPFLEAFLTFNPYDHLPCSGVAAWGAATADGQMYAGASTDHDCTFQATIVAFPRDGHSFVHTPFSANGFLPGMGDFCLAGHPGMNSAGLTYVHHGGGGQLAEPPQEWGYGVRRGPAVFHALGGLASAEEARSYELSVNVGDGGTVLGSVGGFWADGNYAYVLEGRPGAPVSSRPYLRERSYDGQGSSYDFLYANNNALSPLAGGNCAPPEGGYRFGHIEGWYPATFAEMGPRGPLTGFRMAAKSSAVRNRYAFDRLKEAYGSITQETIHDIYATGGRRRDATNAELLSQWASGHSWAGSIAHRKNAFVATVTPADRVYRGCVGPASRHLSAMGTGFGNGFYYFDETNAFFELRVGQTVDEVRQAAESVASERIAAAEAAVRTAGGPAGQRARRWLKQAQRARRDGRQSNGLSSPESEGRRLRQLTVAQVRAEQARTAAEHASA